MHLHAQQSHPPAPLLTLNALDTLWLQVTGTLCNLACRHCFISCGPKNDNHPFMSVSQVAEAISGARAKGVRDYYFTGGEPFMHPDIFRLIDIALDAGPLTILTNGILIGADEAARCREIFDSSRHSFDLRVSLDGTSAAANDPIRGGGSFEKIMAGIRALADAGLNPVLTVTEVDEATPESREKFRTLLAAAGLQRPRMKFLAPFRIGREERRGRSYERFERLAEGDLIEGEEELLQCASSRMVTAKGWYPCPILIEESGARMGGTLEDATRAIRLDHPACYTCHVEGVSCRT